MNSLDLMSIKNQLEKTYDFKIDDIKHIRSMIGHVYTLENEKHKFILKLNRPNNKISAIQATEIIEYLNENDYPVVELVKTRNNENYFDFNTEEGKYIGFVYYYVEGKEPNIEKEVKQIGQQVGLFHNLMKGYQKPIIHRSKEFYIDRFIKILIKSDYDKNLMVMEKNFGEKWKNQKMEFVMVIFILEICSKKMVSIYFLILTHLHTLFP
jgi:Ser/Thr protein kinase RdoA (MazF antagonist)